jgi:proteasome accessory factor A
LCGADIELGNFILGLERATGTGYEASRALLSEIEGAPRASGYQHNGYTYSYGNTYASGWGQPNNPQDWGGRFLRSNGGCVYIDLDHLEVAIPEVISAFDHVAAWHAMLRIVRRAWQAANAKLPEGQTLRVLVNNSDGRSNSYGSHLNFLVTRRAWDNIFTRKLQYQLFLAACQASSIVFTGQGKVGSENGAPEACFQLSQRADFFETMVGVQTTFHRPIVNSRDEALCGKAGSVTDRDMARLHCIFFDAGLCHVASLLKVGMMQIVLAMIEAENISLQILLDDPVEAVRRWSHDASLQARAPMASGAQMTAVEVQLLLLEHARRFWDAGGCDGIVPRADEILRLWEDTVLKLKAGDLPALAPRLDWVLKFRTLQRAMQRHPELTWDSPAIRHLDQIYGSLDPTEGLYWAFEASGAVEQIVPAADIEHFVQNPPRDTRAWARALLLRMAGPDGVAAVDWDWITFRSAGPGYRHVYRTLDLTDPLAFGKAEVERVVSPGASLPEMLELLGAEHGTAWAKPVSALPPRYLM